MTDPSLVRDRVLILCTHNSARSQIAEPLLRELGGERWDYVITVCDQGPAWLVESPAGSAA